MEIKIEYTDDLINIYCFIDNHKKQYNYIKIKYKENKYYIIDYSCNHCSQFDIYILCYTIYKAISKKSPNENTKIYYRVSKNSNKKISKIDNSNMFLLLKWKLYVNKKKISSRKINKINLIDKDIILKTKYYLLKNNLKIFFKFFKNQKLYKYIYVFNN